MNVAIIGAGVSGLSCAYELERHGVVPTVFEKESIIGDSIPHMSVLLNIESRPVVDITKYLNSFGINLTPLNHIKKIVHHSPKKVVPIKGNHGLFYIRGKEENSLVSQISNQLKKTKIIFDCYADYKELSKIYDYVVIATGSPCFSFELGCWQEWLQTYVKGAVVLGSFDPTALFIWANKDYLKNGYAYLAPYDKNRASLIMVVDNINEKEIDYYWERFLYAENIRYEIVEEFKREHKAGYTYPHKIENIYMVGIAGGMLDPFLGFGAINGIVSGIKAARAIALNEDYEELIKTEAEKMLELMNLRKEFNNLKNKNIDNLFTIFSFFGVKQLMYNSSINIAKIVSLYLRFFNACKSKK